MSLYNNLIKKRLLLRLTAFAMWFSQCIFSAAESNQSKLGLLKLSVIHYDTRKEGFGHFIELYQQSWTLLPTDERIKSRSYYSSLFTTKCYSSKYNKAYKNTYNTKIKEN